MASRFWVGGTGTWDGATTTHWAATTGGAGGASVPGSSDTVTFDGSSGAGTVTVNTTVNVQSITLSANTGQTIDFSANNNNVTIGSFSSIGAGSRTLNMGNGTWTLTGTGSTWNIAGGGVITLNANSSVLTFTGATALSRAFTSGGKTYSTVNIAANTGGGPLNIGGAPTISTLNISGPNNVKLAGGTTLTVTSLSISGLSSGAILIESDSGSSTTATISVASGTVTPQWTVMRALICSGGATFTASNSFDLGNNSGVTIGTPVAGGVPASRVSLGM